MYLSRFSCSQFRNLESLTIDLSSKLTLFFGDNAAGKSSILEGISYLVSGRSFRSSKANLLVNHKHVDFTLHGRFSNNENIGVGYSSETKSRRIKFNLEKVKSLSSVVSFYPTQVLSPESYHLIDSGPSERRKYLDWVLFHVEQSYQKSWSSFQKILSQRNAFLRKNQFNYDAMVLDSWDKQLVEIASNLDTSRKAIVKRLLPILLETLDSIGFSEPQDIKLTYYSGYTGQLAMKLTESRQRDLSNNSTLYGPHRADLRIKVGNNFAKDVLSRGQKKLLVNGLFLAQTSLLKEITGKDSLFIIDDFTSELDESSQKSLIERLREQSNVQIILSCLNVDMIKPLIKEYNGVRMFHVEHGRIKSV